MEPLEELSKKSKLMREDAEDDFSLNFENLDE